MVLKFGLNVASNPFRLQIEGFSFDQGRFIDIPPPIYKNEGHSDWQDQKVKKSEQRMAMTNTLPTLRTRASTKS